MRLRTSLFELMLLLTPAVALLMGLLMAALNSSSPAVVLTLAQSALLLAVLIAVCCAFHARSGVRTFARAFLAASLGHMLLVFLANQSAYGTSFPSTYTLTAIWNQIQPEQASAATAMGNSYWTSYPVVMGSSGMMPGSGYSGGMMFGGGMPFPTGPAYMGAQPIFVEVGLWTTSLLLGVTCGMAAKALQGTGDKSAAGGAMES